MSGDPKVQLVLDCHTDLGESPVWDERTGRLYFVDINEKRIHVYHVESKEHFTIDAPVSRQALSHSSHPPSQLVKQLAADVHLAYTSEKSYVPLACSQPWAVLCQQTTQTCSWQHSAAML